MSALGLLIARDRPILADLLYHELESAEACFFYQTCSKVLWEVEHFFEVTFPFLVDPIKKLFRTESAPSNTLDCSSKLTSEVSCADYVTRKAEGDGHNCIASKMCVHEQKCITSVVPISTPGPPDPQQYEREH